MEPGWDKSWEELCSSEEDIAELKELAFLLAKMDPVQASPSFQEELKKKLFKQKKAGAAFADRKLFSLNGFKTQVSGKWARPLFVTAATVILIISLTFFYGDARPGQQDPLLTAQKDFVPETSGPGGALIEEPSGWEENGGKNSEGDVESGSVVEEPALGQESETLDPHGDDPHRDDNKPPVKEETGPISGQKEEPPSTGIQVNPVEVEEDIIKEEPQFEIWGKQLQVQLAADIKLPDYYYNVVPGEKDLCPADVRYTWRPGGKFNIAVNGEDKSGLEPEISKKLSEKGFQVEGAYLKVNSIQETQKGIFAEVFFKPRKSSADDPLLVVYYEDGKDIISFYCEEKGSAAGLAYYRLLSPAQAFERTKDAKIYASSELLRFSFQEVNLTYYEFPLGDGRQEKLVKLPAYCFTGMDTGPGGKEFKLYLPAVVR